MTRMYKFLDARGRETGLARASDFVAAVRDGRIRGSTLVFDPSHARWQPAEELYAYHVAVSAAEANLTPVSEQEAPTSTTLDDHSAAKGERFGPGASDEYPLPAQSEEHLTSGSDRKHGWPGVLYYSLAYLGAGLAGIGSLVVPLFFINEDESGARALFALLFLGGVSLLYFFLGRGVQHFRPWARITALGLAYLSAFGGLLTAVASVSRSEAVGGMVSVVIAAIFIVYFHHARGMFSDGDRGRGGPTAETSMLYGTGNIESSIGGHPNSSLQETERQRRIRFACPYCHKAVEAPENSGELKCPHCRRLSWASHA